MNKYVYQKFLLNCDYENVDLKSLKHTDRNLDYVPEYGQGYSLLDVGNNCVIRKIDLSHLDDIIDTEEDWNAFIKSLNNIDILIIQNADMEKNNDIICKYRVATFKAYLKRLQGVRTEIEIA